MTSMAGTVQLAFMKSFAVWNDFEIYTDTIGLVVTLGSLSNHDDDGNKNPQICIFDNEKQYFCTLCTCIFRFLTFCRRSPSFYDVK